jgi:RNA polymerase sigma-70 factor (ECF subfamily)
MEMELALALAGPRDRRRSRARQQVAQSPTDDLVVQQFRSVVRRQETALLARALVLARDPEAARDLVQDSLLKAFASLRSFQPGSNMTGWLMKILVNQFIDRYRRRSAQPLLVPLCENALEVATVADREPPLASATVSLEQLRAAFEQLRPAFREAYHLRIVERLSYDQIAARLNIPSGTVGTRLRRARQQLRRLLAADELLT